MKKNKKLNKLLDSLNLKKRDEKLFTKIYKHYYGRFDIFIYFVIEWATETVPGNLLSNGEKSEIVDEKHVKCLRKLKSWKDYIKYHKKDLTFSIHERLEEDVEILVENKDDGDIQDHIRFVDEY